MSSPPHDPLPPMTSCSGGAVGWTRASWRLPAHPVLPTCVCMRCVWRRVHSVFWESVYVGGIACTTMPPKPATFTTHRDCFEDNQYDPDETMADEDDVTPGTPPSDEGSDAEGVFRSERWRVVAETLPQLSHAPTSRAAALPGPPAAIILPGQRQAHDRLKPLYAPVFPNVHRVYDEKSRAVAHIAWQFANADEIWSIVNCKLLGAGLPLASCTFTHIL